MSETVGCPLQYLDKERTVETQQFIFMPSMPNPTEGKIKRKEFLLDSLSVSIVREENLLPW